MEDKFWNKTTIFGLAGLLAYAVTTLVLFIPFKGDPSMSLINWQSPLGIIVVALFVVSICLFTYGIFKKEPRLSYRDVWALVEERNQYLPSLLPIIRGRLERASELASEAGQQTLDFYRGKYLLHSWKYVICKMVWGHNIALASQNALAWTGFMTDNLYYSLLKDNDRQYQLLVTQYSSVIALITDGKLKNLINRLWTSERIINSSKIWTLLSKKSGDVPHTPSGIRLAQKGEVIGVDDLERQFEKVVARIKELKEGAYDQ